jgi:transcriptional regulator PpsR
VSDDPDDSPDLAALSAWAPQLAQTFVSLASDIALVIDADGVIRNVAQGGVDPIAPGASQWVGRAWIDTVSAETRAKIANLLKEVAATGIARRREVNHPLGADSTIPVAYTAIRLGAQGPVLAVGRDLRTIAAIQQRYVESQQDMERGYWKARQSEARYQLLFQVATDAVLVVDGATLRIVESNLAATTLLGEAAEPGRTIGSGFEHHSRGAVNELLVNARASGQSGEIRARLQGTNTGTSVLATPFRADDAMRLLVRMRATDSSGPAAGLNPSLSRLVDSASDGVVVTDSSGRILIANPAFQALVHVAGEAQVAGKPLTSWLGLADQPLAALIGKVRRDGIARHVECWIRHGDAAARQVEVSAALLTEGDQECLGFTIHPTTGRGIGAEDVEDASSEALARVFKAGLEALSGELDPPTLAAVMRRVAGIIGRPEAT